MQFRSEGWRPALLCPHVVERKPWSPFLFYQDTDLSHPRSSPACPHLSLPTLRGPSSHWRLRLYPLTAMGEGRQAFSPNSNSRPKSWHRHSLAGRRQSSCYSEPGSPHLQGWQHLAPRRATRGRKRRNRKQRPQEAAHELGPEDGGLQGNTLSPETRAWSPAAVSEEASRSPLDQAEGRHVRVEGISELAFPTGP